MNGAPAKASTQIKLRDRVEVFVERERILEVAAIIDKRVSAKVAATCVVDHSPPAPVVKRRAPAPRRPQGMGRPTKRDRREMDRRWQT